MFLRLLRTLLLALSLSVLASVSALAVDADGDGVDDATDNCVGLSNPTQVDVDVDGVGNACDKCIVVSNSTQVDGDGDGFGNACDNCRTKDNGPVEPVAPSDPAWAARLLQYDTNQEGYGNACDADYDNTGVVSIGDFNTFKLAYMTAVGDPAFNPHCDANADDLVDDTDFAVFQSLYGKAPGPSDLSCAGTAPCLPPNEPPVLAGIGNRTLVLGDLLAIDVQATDRQRQPVTLSVTPMPLPAGASFDLAGHFRFTPTAIGTYSFSFKASDGSLDATESMTVSVSAPGATDPTQLSGLVQDAAVAAGGSGTLGIAGATVKWLSGAGQPETTTAADGSFTLTFTGTFSGPQQIEFSKLNYAGYRMTRTLPIHVTSHLDRPVYMTPVSVTQDCSGSPIPAGCYDPDVPNTVTATVPGGVIQLTVPPDSIAGSNPGPDNDDPRAITIAEVNPDFTPGALPETLRPSLVITIQPMGLEFTQALPIRLPNRDGYAIETNGGILDLWSLDHDTGRFFVAGRGQVTSSGLVVDPVAVPGTRGGILESSWHFMGPLVTEGQASPQGDGTSCGDGCPKGDVASDLSLGDGGVSERIELPRTVSQGQRRELDLVYRSKTAYPAPVIPVEPTIPARTALPDLVSYSLRVGGSQVSAPAYTDTNTSSISEFQTQRIRGAVQFDAREIPTGAFDYRLRQTSHYLTFANGTQIGIDTPGRVVVQNEIASPFGAGWGLEGVSRLVLNQPDGALLLVDGSGSFRVFDRADQLRTFDSAEWAPTRPQWVFAGATTAQRVSPPPGIQATASWLYSSFEFSNSTLRGTLRVPASSIARPIGFAVGYLRALQASDNPPAPGPGVELINFSWRRAGSDGPPGMFLIRVNGENDLAGTSLSEQCLSVLPRDPNDPNTPQDLVDPRCSMLDENAVPFQYDTTYQFDVTYESHRVRVRVQGPGVDEELEGFGTFQPGRFAFWSGAQRGEYQLFDNIAPSWTGPAGDTTTIVQDGVGQGFRRIFSDGTIHHFDSTGKQTQRVDANGNETEFQYDPQGRLAAILDPKDLATTLSYNGTGGRLSSIQDPASRLTLFQHDAGGNLSDVTYPDGSTRHFTYDARHLLLTETDQRGNLTEHEYDFAGRLVKAILPDPSGTESERTAAAAQTIGLVNRAEEGASESDPAPVVLPPQDGSGPRSTYTDAEGRVTEYGIGSFLLASSVKAPDGVTSTFTRDANGDVTQLTRRIEGATPANPSTQDVAASFDTQRNPLSITDNKLIGTTTFSYDPPFVDGAPVPSFNTLKTVIEPRNQAASGDRDLNLGYSGPNLSSIATPGGRTQTLSYDPVTDGLPATLTDVFGRVAQLSYDPATRNLTALTHGTDLTASLQRTTSFSYTPEGLVNTITDAVGRVLDFDYDPMGRVDDLTLPDLRSIDFSYDSAGNLTSIQPPGRPNHDFAYDERDREEQYTPPAIGGTVATTFEYNRESQLTQVNRPDGQTLVLSYQAGTGRLLSLTQPGGSTTLAYSTAPAGSATGLLSSVTESFTSGAMTFGYQGDRLKSTTWSGPVSGSVSLNFFEDGLVKDESVNGSNLVNFLYDKDGLLTNAGSMMLTRNESTGFLETASLSGLSTSRTRNEFGELTSESTGSHYSVQYPSRDKLGRVTTKIESLQGGPSKTTQYTYDARGRLGQVFEDSLLVRDYRYDDNSNRTSSDGGLTQIGFYDAQDRLTSYGAASYTYTANGELLTKLESGQTTSYAYDLLGNLRTVNLPDGRSLSYVIDGANRRIGKRINGTPVQGFLYGDQLEPVAELDGSNTLVSRFVYGSKPNVPDYMVKGGQTFRILSDQLGTVRLVVSTTGVVRQRVDYDEFGKIASRQEFDSGGVLITPTPAPFQPFGFAGGLVDYDTNLVRFGARDYDPAVGRWTSKDPIRFDGGNVNLYGYVLGDPVNLVDPSGDIPPLILAAAAIAAGGAIGIGVPLGLAYAVGDECDFEATQEAAKAAAATVIGAAAVPGVIGATGELAPSITAIVLGSASSVNQTAQNSLPRAPVGIERAIDAASAAADALSEAVQGAFTDESNSEGSTCSCQ